MLIIIKKSGATHVVRHKYYNSAIVRTKFQLEVVIYKYIRNINSEWGTFYFVAFIHMKETKLVNVECGGAKLELEQ